MHGLNHRYIELVQYVTYEALYRVMINTIAELTKQAKHLIEDQLDLDSCHTKKVRLKYLDTAHCSKNESDKCLQHAQIYHAVVVE